MKTLVGVFATPLALGLGIMMAGEIGGIIIGGCLVGLLWVGIVAWKRRGRAKPGSPGGMG